MGNTCPLNQTSQETRHCAMLHSRLHDLWMILTLPGVIVIKYTLIKNNDNKWHIYRSAYDGWYMRSKECHCTSVTGSPYDTLFAKIVNAFKQKRSTLFSLCKKNIISGLMFGPWKSLSEPPFPLEKDSTRVETSCH